MSGLADVIRGEHRQGGMTQLVPKILAGLDSADRADLEAALADPTVSGGAIGRALRARGIRVSDAAIYNHRRRVG